MTDRTPYQDKIIKRYYNNMDALMTQKISELVSDLYLTEGKKRSQVWKRIAAALSNLKVPQDRIDYLVGRDDPVLVAKLLNGDI